MKSLIFLVLSLFFGISYGQDVNSIIKEADLQVASMNDVPAINTYREALKLQPSNLYVLCQCSELCSRIGGRLQHDKKEQADYYAAAKTYASEALQVNSLSSEANFVNALVMGTAALHGSGKEKIDAVKNIKRYADLAIKYDAKNYKAWYVLGKWYYEISNLNYFERTAVKIFYGPLPPASIADAIRCFEKSKAINPRFVLNYLSLAKAYKKNDDQNTARQNLQVMFTLPDKTQDDAGLKNEGRSLLKKWD
ncbi:MAG: hypothetical protein ABI472_20970 [Ginsengibacter sp.]